jgi:hypothetical protein
MGSETCIGILEAFIIHCTILGCKQKVLFMQRIMR